LWRQNRCRGAETLPLASIEVDSHQQHHQQQDQQHHTDDQQQDQADD